MELRKENKAKTPSAELLAAIQKKAQQMRDKGCDVFENLSNGYTVQTASGKILRVITQQEAAKLADAMPEGVSTEDWILYVLSN